VRLLVLLVVLAAALAAPSVAAAAPVASAVAKQAQADPLVVTLDASGSVADSGRTIVEYRWDFGDGSPGAGVRVDHRYPAPGPYTVTLVVTDDAGATSSSALSVVVRTIGFDLSQRSLVWGSTAAVTGAVEPAEVGLEVVIEQARGGSWQELSRVQTDSGGRYALLLAPAASGLLRARLAVAGGVSAPVAVSVAPKVVLRPAKPGLAFVGVRLTGRVFPSSYDGRVTIIARRRGKEVAHVAVRVRAGRLNALLPIPGIGRFAVLLQTSPGAGLASRRAATQVRARLPGRLDPGARGPRVTALARRLLDLGFHVPRTRSVLGPSMRDAVTAFQASARLAPTGTVTERVWRALARARPLLPRFRRPSLHLELDLRRRLLVLVREGRTAGILPLVGSVRSGTFTIRSKSGVLAAGGFAIKGAPSPLPAPDGYVTVPVWAAGWLFSRSRVGERVYVYP